MFACSLFATFSMLPKLSAFTGGALLTYCCPNTKRSAVPLNCFTSSMGVPDLSPKYSYAECAATPTLLLPTLRPISLCALTL
jgi:hypothetical protein